MMKYSVCSLIAVIVLSILILSGCDQTTEPGVPTEVEILNPATGVVLSEVIDVSLSILNDSDLKYVQIMIDGEEAGRINKGVSKWAFNPVFYNDGQSHTMIAIATDKDGSQNQSGVVSFSVDPSTVLNPVYTAPSSGYIYAENEEVKIDWEPVVNAVKYTVQISDDKNFANVLSEQTTEADQVSFGVLENKVHYFRFTAENSTAKTSAWTTGKKLYVGVDDITWMNFYNYGTGPEWGNAVVELPDNTVITVGPCLDSDMEYARTSVVKTDLNGDVVWNKFIGPAQSITYGNDVLYDGEHIYVLGGQVPDYSSYEFKIILTKMDMSGNTIWSKTYGSDGSWGFNIVLGTDGFFYVDCYYNSSASILKIDTSGSIKYAYSKDNASWMRFDFDHNDELVILYGDYYDYTRRVKLNENGLELSDESFGTSMIDYSKEMFADQNGIYLYEYEYRLIKFGYDGNIISQMDLSDYEIESVHRHGDYFYATGSNYLGLGVMIKINSSMAVESTHSYNCGLLTNLTVLSDGSFVLCGTNTEYVSTNSDMVLLKTDKQGNCDSKTELPKSYGEKLDVLHDRIKPRDKR